MAEIAEARRKAGVSSISADALRKARKMNLLGGSGAQAGEFMRWIACVPGFARVRWLSSEASAFTELDPQRPALACILWHAGSLFRYVQKTGAAVGPAPQGGDNAEPTPKANKKAGNGRCSHRQGYH